MKGIRFVRKKFCANHSQLDRCWVIGTRWEGVAWGSYVSTVAPRRPFTVQADVRVGNADK